MEANKFRPHSLNEVIGQEKVVTALKNYFKKGTFPNCSIFCGHSGSGKNTLANIVAQTLSCKSPITKEDGMIEPCHTCPSCKIIEQELPNDSIEIYNGKDMKAEDITALNSKLQYDPLPSTKRIFIINEAQGVFSLSKLLEIIEVPRKDTYFILTSSDTKKFKNNGQKDNKNQEQAAIRSRVAYFQINPVSATEISSLLFDIVEKKGIEVPDIFYEEGIHLIAENSKGNIRQAINDMDVALNAEVYTKVELQDLLGYEDEQDYTQKLIGLIKKDVVTLESILELDDINSFFFLSWKILNDVCIKGLTNKTFAESWKERNALEILSLPNYELFLTVYEKTNEKCYGFFNEKIFINELYRYYKNNAGVTRLLEGATKKKTPIVK